MGKKASVIETPMNIRILDNLLLGVIFIILILRSRLNYRYIYDTNKLLIFLSIIIVLDIIYSCFYHNYLVVLVGIDSFLPIFMILFFLFLDESENKSFHNKIVSFLVFFLYLNLGFQLTQLFLLKDYYHPTFFDLSQRTIGFFREPNTLALFDIISMYFVYTYMLNNIHKKIILFILLPLSIILSGSMTALLTLILILIYLNFKIDIKRFIFFSIIIGICFFFIAPYIPSRPGLENSIITRLDIIIDNFYWDRLLLSSDFGIGTNIAYILNLSNIVPESTLASNLINIGTIGTIVFYLIFISILNTKQGVLFSICILTMSLSNIIYSAYPINLLFAFEMAYLINYSKKENNIDSNIN